MSSSRSTSYISVKSDVGKLHLKLMAAKDFSSFMEVLTAYKSPYNLISQLDLGNFIALVEHMIKLHYNENYADRMRYDATRDVRKKSISLAFSIDYEDDDVFIKGLELECKRDIIATQNILRLGVMLNAVAQALHKEKGDQAKNTSVLGSHISAIITTLLQNKRVEIEEDINKAKALKDKAEEELIEVSAQLKEAERHLLDAKVHIANAQNEADKIKQSSIEQEAKLQEQLELIKSLEAKQLEQQELVENLQQEAELAAIEVAMAEASIAALKQENKLLKEQNIALRKVGKKALGAIDSVFNELSIELSQLQKQITLMIDEVNSRLENIARMNASLSTCEDKRLSILMKGRIAQELSFLQDHLKRLQNFGEQANNIIQTLNKGRDDAAIKEARSIFFDSKHSGFTEIQQDIRAVAIRKKVEERLLQLGLNHKLQDLEPRIKAIAEGDYSHDFSSSIAAFQKILSSTDAVIASQSETIAMTTKAMALAQGALEDNFDIQEAAEYLHRDLDDAQLSITKAEANLATAKQKLANARAKLSELNEVIRGIRSKVRALTGVGNESALRAERLKQYFDAGHQEEVKEILKTAVDKVITYLRSAEAKKFLVKDGNEKADALLTISLDIESASTGEAIAKIYNDLHDKCLESRTILAGNKLLDSTPSANKFDNAIDFAISLAVKTSSLAYTRDLDEKTHTRSEYTQDKEACKLEVRGAKKALKEAKAKKVRLEKARKEKLAEITSKRDALRQKDQASMADMVHALGNLGVLSTTGAGKGESSKPTLDDDYLQVIHGISPSSRHASW